MTRIPPRDGLKTDPAGVAAIPAATSSAPPTPPPLPSGRGGTKARMVAWRDILATLRRWNAGDLYDEVGGRYGTTDAWLVREFADRIRRLDTGDPEVRDGLAAGLDLLAVAAESAGEPVVEHAIQMSGGDMQVRCDDPEIERIYPLDQWIPAQQRFGGKVYRRTVIVVEDWHEVPKVEE